MKSVTVLLPLLLPALATSKSIFFGKQDTLVVDGSLDVPGTNPMTYCQDPSDNILAIEHINLAPNPPTSGDKFSIEAAGVLSQDIEEGAYINLSVKYGLITLIRQTADLCEQADTVEKECPVQKGELRITKDVELPSQIPPGKYTVLADVYTKDDKRITCLQATVVFP